MDFEIEAVYYLEQTNYDFKGALKEYVLDLQTEIQMAKDLKKNPKKRLPEDGKVGCLGNNNCNIF